MATFQTLNDLPLTTQREYERISAIASGSRLATEQAFLDALVAYTDNEILATDEDGNIQEAKGDTLPTGFSGFAKSALFTKKDVAAGTKALYENTGDATTAAWDLIGAITAGEISLADGKMLIGGADGLAAAKTPSGDATMTNLGVLTIANLAITAAKLAASVDLNGKAIQIPSGTPVNAVAATGSITYGSPVATDTVVVDGNTFTCVAATPAAGEFSSISELTALVTALASVNATDNGTVISIVAATKGVAGNALALSVGGGNTGTLAVSGAHLTAGVDGTVGAVRQLFVDASYLYFASAANTIADTNWRRIALGSAY